MVNKLFCTFVDDGDVEDSIESIKRKYTINYNKIFVLYSKHTNEYMLTYNVDYTNVETLPDRTIVVHRKKDTNTLYTINALNSLIVSLNDGKLDKDYLIDWEDYRNTLLITKGVDLIKIKTSLYKISEV